MLWGETQDPGVLIFQILGLGLEEIGMLIGNVCGKHGACAIVNIIH